MSQSMADLFKTITTGVHVIGVADGEIRNAFTAASVRNMRRKPHNRMAYRILSVARQIVELRGLPRLLGARMSCLLRCLMQNPFLRFGQGLVLGLPLQAFDNSLSDIWR